MTVALTHPALTQTALAQEAVRRGESVQGEARAGETADPRNLELQADLRQAGVEPVLSRARVLAAEGDDDQAELLLREARRVEAAAPPRVQAELALQHAAVLTRQAKDDPAAVERAVAAYARALELGDEQQVATALNNRGVLLLASQPERAVASLRQSDEAALPPALRPLHSYNLGRALEAVGDPGAALGSYLGAVRLEPTYGRAVERAADLLAASDPATAVAGTVALGTLLLEAGQRVRFERELAPLVASHPGPATLALYARHLAARPPECDGGDWRPRLGGDGGDGASLGPWLRELRRAVCPPAVLVSSDDPAHLLHAAQQAFATWWSDPESAAALADLLVALGDRERRAGDLDRALARYFVAWRFADGHARAAQRCAAVLADAAESPSRLPLEPRQPLAEALLASSPGGEDPQSWRRTHLLLADFAARRGDEVAARAQLEHALRAEQAQVEGGGRRSPGLHLRVAAAARDHQPELAVASWLAAAGAFLEHDDPRRAGESLARVEAQEGRGWSADTAVRIERLREAVAAAWLAAGRPELTAGTPFATPGGSLCVCGELPRPEHAFALRLDGHPVAVEGVDLEEGVVLLQLPSDLAVGRHVIDGDPAAGFGDPAWSFEAVKVGVTVEDARRRKRDVAIRVVGSDRPVELSVINRTPGIFRLAGGDEQRVTTSGGSPNRVVLRGRFLAPGRAEVTGRLEHRCPCAEPPPR